uniref:Aminoacyl-tRNA synthetase class II (D/K/N) domain-containing protein n=1 Tax=Nelumbo nucifera TaxID=4432 RepID=A0A822XVQ0_NELNU|nr:TPA_asm: hypothetical protein HUJ06_025535 [Nelumbo nucifera]
MASEEGAFVEPRVAPSKYSERVVLKSIVGRSDRGSELIGERVVIGGWVKSSKEQVKDLPQQPSIPCKHVVELKVEKILHIGTVDPARYPLAKPKVPLEVLQGYPHLRPRTITVASITRIRSALTHATHTFFQNHGFLYVHTPVITTTDAEGFSEKFQVTTHCIESDQKLAPKATQDDEAVNLENVKAAIMEKSKKIEELKRSESNREALFAALEDLKKANELASQLEAKDKLNHRNSIESGKREFSKDFFSHKTFLTVSGQLHLESYACSLGSVYTFGPRFRAEKQQNRKHLAEMWEVELEMAFSHLEDVMACAEDYLKFLCQWVLENCSEDMQFVKKRIDRSVTDRLKLVASNSFEKITYTEAVELLMKVTERKFKEKIEWGVSLTEEHESYLTDEIFKRPVIIYNFPKEVKPFYARLNDDGKTVATVDIVLPKVGTLIRGSQKEERIDLLTARIKDLDFPREQYDWYLDLRRHGTVKHSGFSLSFDHMVLFASGLIDIRDVIPFPRSHGNVSY